MWAALKLCLAYSAILTEIVLHLAFAPLLWWGRLRRRDAEVERQVERIASGWARRCLRYMQCRVQVEGLEHLPASGPVILMANHQSMFDIPLCLGFLGRTMGFVAKRELFRIPALSFWMRQIHCANMDRADVRSSGKLLEELSHQVREGGYLFLIFPEGTRTRHPEGEIGPFRRGALRLAAAEGMPVVPISVDGTRFLVKFKALRKVPPSRRVVRVRVAPAVRVAKGLSAPESKRLMEQIRHTIVSNWRDIRIDWRVS